ncbi:MAG: peptidyl-prolyl cis-trans isomerase [Deltaproteobacteria bacterium]|nr:peptidyl-prolyl cis-trans isomerase [Deltaproteobacteria bacterium]
MPTKTPTKLTSVLVVASALVLTGCPFFTSEADSDRGIDRAAGTTIRVERPSAPAPAPPPTPAPSPRAVPTPAPTPTAAAGDEISVRHILVQYRGATRAAPDNERAKEDAHVRAQEALGKARSGEDFAALAGEYSDGPTRTRGGDLRSFGRGRMHPAFEQAAFALEVDEVSGIVETPFGYHVILRYQ